MAENAASGIIIAGLIIFALYSCNKKPEDTDEYKKGHEIGYEEGHSDGRTDTCNQIENFKDSIHTALQNEGICP